jgi:hypothetical protein
MTVFGLSNDKTYQRRAMDGRRSLATDSKASGSRRAALWALELEFDRWALLSSLLHMGE